MSPPVNVGILPNHVNSLCNIFFSLFFNFVLTDYFTQYAQQINLRLVENIMIVLSWVAFSNVILYSELDKHNQTRCIFMEVSKIKPKNGEKY